MTGTVSGECKAGDITGDATGESHGMAEGLTHAPVQSLPVLASVANHGQKVYSNQNLCFLYLFPSVCAMTGFRFLHRCFARATIIVDTFCALILGPRGLCHCCGRLVHVNSAGISFSPLFGSVILCVAMQ